MAGQNFERQENDLIKTIDNAFIRAKRQPFKVKAGSVTIANVVDAGKYEGRQVSGSEPYTDVVLFLDDGSSLNLSCKGEAAPSLAGGGLKGIELAIPGLARSFFEISHNHLLKVVKLKPGSVVPNIYGKLSLQDKLILAVGNESMGGPIDYMYIGPMDVKGSYDERTNTLSLNGKLIAADEFARTHDLYFRLRARREDQRFDPNSKDSAGIPRIYSRSPSKGDVAGRLVVTDSVPKNAVMVNLK
jgi:hypothetical protein